MGQGSASELIHVEMPKVAAACSSMERLGFFAVPSLLPNCTMVQHIIHTDTSQIHIPIGCKLLMDLLDAGCTQWPP